MLKRLFLLSFTCLLSGLLYAQQPSYVEGIVRDSAGKPVETVIVLDTSSMRSVLTDVNGSYRLRVEPSKATRLQYSYQSCRRLIFIPSLAPGAVHRLDLQLECVVFLGINVVVEAEKREIGTTILKPKHFLTIPNPSMDVSTLLKTLPGVSSNNELSTQYNVRGGNYDENLVYVNDIEIYRPFLVRSGQQEGLSFVNPDLIQSISFSAGGFAARYGDKMSSVLDIKYKEPVNKKPRGSVNLNLLGGSAHIEGSAKNHRFTYVAGIRRRSNQYLLNSLDVQGSYKPVFTDVQSYMTYHFTSKLSLGWLFNYTQNRYLLIPEDRETSFGTATNALRLFIAFNGRELMQYRTLTNALSLKYDVNERTSMKLFASTYQSEENEYTDVEGAYLLDQLDNDLGSPNYGKVKFNRGAGYFINHARNDLNATVYNLNHTGSHSRRGHLIQWGARYQHERIQDKLSEWKYNDSAGFAVPNNRGGVLNLDDANFSRQDIASNRYTAYVQDEVILNDSSNMTLNLGVRTQYWDLNEELLLSPRMQFSFEPNRRYNRRLLSGEDSLLKKDISLKAAIGVYHQPPFYRELRNIRGQLNTALKAQRSIHFVLGGDMNFTAWSRPFKFVTELYYKKLDNLVPYEIDNVRIRYYATNNSRGDAKGIDMKVNGEFIPDLESWASLSVMQVREDIIDDFYYEYGDNGDSTRIEPGFIPRPTDQRVNFGLFFQDYLPKFPSYRMSLNLVFGSGLPFGPPDFTRYRDTLRIPPYRRVDIGFSKQLLDGSKKKTRGLGRHFRSAWLSAEVFNLLQIQNTISYIWVKDIVNQTYAVPNYLTSRRVNLHLVVNF